VARNANSRRAYYRFVDLESQPFRGRHISSIDCFHPSEEGEALLSEVLWIAGPFD
jgi:hypothetical protein